KEIGDVGLAAAVAFYQRNTKTSPFEGAERIEPSGKLTSIYAGSGEGLAEEVGWFSFGDLVAIYGDMRATFEELNDAASKPRAQALRAVAATGDYAHNKPEQARMLALAYVNETHFAGKAAEAYVRWHAQALE